MPPRVEDRGETKLIILLETGKCKGFEYMIGRSQKFRNLEPKLTCPWSWGTNGDSGCI